MTEKSSDILSVWLLLGALVMTGPVVMACIALVATVTGMLTGLASILALFIQEKLEFFFCSFIVRENAMVWADFTPIKLTRKKGYSQ